MTNPTSNFGWQMPTSTDLVTDLPADFETFGQAVDTSLADLKGGTTGQILSKASNTNMDFTWVTTDDANAIQNSIVDAKGDIVAASANDTPARLAVGANGETLVADSSTSTGLRYTALFGANKNKIINGDLNVNQRAFTSTTSNAVYTFDRFFTLAVGGTSTYSAQTFTPGTAPVAGYEASNYIRIVTSGQSANSDGTALRHRIEDVRTFAGQTVTVSFWAKANSGTPSIAFEFEQAYGSGGSANDLVQGQKVTISTSWARYSMTFSIPSITGKTIGTGSSVGCAWWVSSGSDRNSRLNSLGIQSNTFEMWGFQIEAGSIATPFQTATGTIQGELAACLRYYWRSEAGSAQQKFAQGPAYGTTNALTNAINLPTPMRVKPTALDYGGTIWLQQHAGAGGTAFTGLVIDADYSNTKQVVLAITTASGLTAGTIYELKANSSSTAYIGLSAEL